MLLVLSDPHPHTIDNILLFIEEHPVLVGVLTSVVVSSLWLKKFISQKRAEAFFGFYAKLSLRLRALQERLEENGQLNVSDPEAGNIFALIYVRDYIVTACPGYTEPAGELEQYKKAASELKEILFHTENNVYPPGSDRKKWYESQHVLFSFCEFLENEAYQHTTNKKCAEGETEPKHIKKCKALLEAMNYIQESINNAKY